MKKHNDSNAVDSNKIIFGLCLVIVILSATLFVAVQGEFFIMQRKANETFDELNTKLSIQAAQKQQKNAPASQKDQISKIIQQYPSRFMEASKDLSDLTALFSALQENGASPDTVDDIIESACKSIYPNKEAVDKCVQILKIVLENVKTQALAPSNQKLSPHEFLADMLADLVNAGLINQNVLSELTTIVNDLKALKTAIESYLENPDGYQAMISAAKKLAEDVANLLKTYGTQEEMIKRFCSYTQMPDMCAMIIEDAATAFKEYLEGNLEEGELLAMLKEDLQELSPDSINQIHEKFVKFNTGFINTLKAEKEILINHLQDNTGSVVLQADIDEFFANFTTEKSAYQELYLLMQTIYTDPDADISQDAMNTAIKNYKDALVNLMKNYPKYGIHTDTTAHYLEGAINNTRILTNHKLYTKDANSAVLLSKKYTGVNTQKAEDLLNGQNGLSEKIKNAFTPILNTAETWFSLFTKTDKTQLQQSYQVARKSQTDANKIMTDIYKTEAQIALEMCKILNADNLALCTYNYGAGLQALAEGESVNEAICSQSDNPDQCLASWASFEKAIEETKNSENPSVQTLIENIVQELLSEEQYNELAELISSAISDEVLTSDEIKAIFAEILGIMYDTDHFDTRISQFISSLCANTENSQECLQYIEDIIQLFKAIYSGDGSAEEELEDILAKIIEDLSSGDTEVLTTTLEQTEKVIKFTLIGNEFITNLLKNRDSNMNTSNLEEDYAYIANKYEQLTAISDEIISIIEELETADDAERVQLSARLTELTIEYGLLLINLERYYLTNYLPNMYAGTYIIFNHAYQRQITTTSMSAQHISDMILISKTTHPEEDWTAIDADFQKITNLTSTGENLIEISNSNLNRILASGNPLQTLSPEMQSTQKELNKTVQNLEKTKKKLTEDVHLLILAMQEK